MTASPSAAKGRSKGRVRLHRQARPKSSGWKTELVEVEILCTRGFNTRHQVLSPPCIRHERVTPGRRRETIFDAGLVHGLLARD